MGWKNMVNDDYVLFTAGMFGLLFGFFGMAASAGFLISVTVGLVSIGTFELVAMVSVFLISTMGSAASYLWFIAAAD